MDDAKEFAEVTQAMLDIGITMDQQVRLGGGELARGSVIKIASHGQQIAASCQQQVQHVSLSMAAHPLLQ